MDNDIILTEEFLDWKWFGNAKTLSVFLFLLLNANTKAAYCRKEKIKRGSITVKNETIAESCGITIQNVRAALANLESSGDITRQRRNRYQIVTITQYERYRDDI